MAHAKLNYGVYSAPNRTVCSADSPILEPERGESETMKKEKLPNLSTSTCPNPNAKCEDCPIQCHLYRLLKMLKGTEAKQ